MERRSSKRHAVGSNVVHKLAALDAGLAGPQGFAYQPGKSVLRGDLKVASPIVRMHSEDRPNEPGAGGIVRLGKRRRGGVI